MDNSYNFTFAIDCDEVLRKTLDRMVELYNKHFYAQKTKEEIKDYKVENSFPEIEEVTGMTASHWFFQEHSTELFLDTEPFPHIKEDIDTLRKYGKVVILTYQKSYQNKIETLMWLQKYGIEADGVCFLKDKTMLTADYLVDDNDWNFNGSHVKHGVLIDAPYNLTKDPEDIKRNSECETLERCANLHEFVVKFTEGIKRLEELRDKYLEGGLHKLKKGVPFKGLPFKFGQKGSNVQTYFSMSGLHVYARLFNAYSLGNVYLETDDLDKYIE